MISKLLNIKQRKLTTFYRLYTMNYKWILYTLTTLLVVSCSSYKQAKRETPEYAIVNISGQIVEMNQEQGSNAEMQAFVNKYKGTLDKQMNEVVGTSSEFMQKGRPESLLTNLTSDVMKAYGDKHFNSGADVAMMNVNGHRATLPEGNITLGTLFEVYSFDNTITFLEVKGEDLSKIFEAYAYIGGKGISSNAQLVIGDRKLKSATLDGKPIDANKIYNVVTIDYLADGNNGMKALRDAVSINDTGITLRDVMIDYVRELTAEGKQISSQLDGRITIE
mgnify:CR=1 FL=1